MTPITSGQYLRDQLSKDGKIDTLKDIIRQFENHTQQHKYQTHNKAMHKTTTDDMKARTQYKPETTNDCTASPHTTN